MCSRCNDVSNMIRIGGRIAVVDGPRTISPVSAEHWSGGDTILRDEMRRGGVEYWTIIYPDDHCTACDGQRWTSPEAAQKALERMADPE